VEELNKSPDDAVIYKSIGSLMIKAESKASVLSEIEEDRETLDIRVKALERQEKSLRERYQVLQDQLNKALSAGAAAPIPAAGRAPND